jgi:hypothetical protein
MNKEQMIEALTWNELNWLVNNPDKHNMTDAAEFFALGGFTTYTDDEIIRAFGKLGD